MISRYAPKGAASKTLTYYTIWGKITMDGESKLSVFAYDSHTSALLASAETMEGLENKMLFLGYAKQIDKEPK